MGAITSTYPFLLFPSLEKERHILRGLHKCQETDFILEVVGERHDKEDKGSSSAWTFRGTEMGRAKGTDQTAVRHEEGKSDIGHPQAWREMALGAKGVGEQMVFPNRTGETSSPRKCGLGYGRWREEWGAQDTQVLLRHLDTPQFYRRSES